MTSGTKGTTPQYMDFTDDIIGYTTDLSKTGDYRLVGPVDGNNYVFNGNKTFSDSLEPTKFTNTIKNNSKKIITAAADTLLKKTEMPVIPEFELITSAAATGNDGTIKPLISSASIKGSEGTDFFRKQFGEPAWANLKGTVNNMGFKGDIA